MQELFVVGETPFVEELKRAGFHNYGGTERD